MLLAGWTKPLKHPAKCHSSCIFGRLGWEVSCQVWHCIKRGGSRIGYCNSVFEKAFRRGNISSPRLTFVNPRKAVSQVAVLLVCATLARPSLPSTSRSGRPWSSASAGPSSDSRAPQGAGLRSQSVSRLVGLRACRAPAGAEQSGRKLLRRKGEQWISNAS